MALDVRVFLEVKRLIQAAEVIIGISSCSCSEREASGTISSSSSSNSADSPRTKQVQCEISEGAVQLSRDCGCRCEIELHCDVLPDGCSGMQWVDGDGLHMRLPVTKLPNTVDWQPLDVCTDAILVCASCHAVISRSDGCAVSRVLPLPSSTWSAAAEQWYCPCKPDRPPMHDGKFTPQLEGDCLQSVGSWTVRAGSLREGATSFSGAADSRCVVLCEKCQHHLGHMDHGATDDASRMQASTCVTLLRGHTLLLPASATTCMDSLSCSCVLEDSFYQQLLEAMRESGYSKFLLHAYDPATQDGICSDGDLENIACLWLMSPAVDVLLKGSWTPSVPESSFAHPTLCKTHTKSERFHRALKVLYKNIETDSVDCEPWLLDARVQSLPFTKVLGSQLMSQLASSTLTLPPSKRVFNGFQVGYLFPASFLNWPD